MQLILLLILCGLQCLCSILPIGNGEYFLLRSCLIGSLSTSDILLAEIAASMASFISIVLFLKCDIIYLLRNLFSNSDNGVIRNNFSMFTLSCLFILVSEFYGQRLMESLSAPLFVGAVSFFCGVFLALIWKIGFFQSGKEKIKPINAVCFGLMQFWSLLPGASVLNTAVFSGFCCGFDGKMSSKYALALLAFSCVSSAVFSAHSLAAVQLTNVNVDYFVSALVFSLFICTWAVELWKVDFTRLFKYFALYRCISGVVFVLFGFLG